MMRTDLYIGVDPGAAGGIVAITDADSHVRWDCLAEMTDYEILRTFGECRASPTTLIEWIHPAIQAIGKSAMSKLYGSYQALRMALMATQISFDDVKPVEWQRGVGIAKRKKTETTSQWKHRLRARAQELYPRLELWQKTKREQLAVCDALLIAHYARTRRNETNHGATEDTE